MSAFHTQRLSPKHETLLRLGGLRLAVYSSPETWPAIKDGTFLVTTDELFLRRVNKADGGIWDFQVHHIYYRLDGKVPPALCSLSMIHLDHIDGNGKRGYRRTKLL